jgi:hypothetical protein
MELVSELDEAAEAGQAAVQMRLHAFALEAIQAARCELLQRTQPETLASRQIGLPVQVVQ